MSTLQDLNQVLSRKQDILENAAGVEKIKKSGKLTARERVELLLDDGSFMEQAMLLNRRLQIRLRIFTIKQDMLSIHIRRWRLLYMINT